MPLAAWRAVCTTKRQAGIMPEDISMSKTTAAAPASVSVSLRLVRHSKSEEVAKFEAADLAANPKSRTAFLRSAHEFVLAGSTAISAADRAMRTAIERPSDLAALAALERAEAAKASYLETKVGIGKMFLAAPSLRGHEYGKTDEGDSINGSHLATALFGAFGKNEAKITLKKLA
jgi:predicted ATPase